VNFRASHTFGPQKSNLCKLFLFGACDERSGYVDATSCERQLNVEGQISRYSNSDVPGLRLRAHSAAELYANKKYGILRIFSASPLINHQVKRITLK
jgi:hypothetical protein